MAMEDITERGIAFGKIALVGGTAAEISDPQNAIVGPRMHREFLGQAKLLGIETIGHNDYLFAQRLRRPRQRRGADHDPVAGQHQAAICPDRCDEPATAERSHPLQAVDPVDKALVKEQIVDVINDHCSGRPSIGEDLPDPDQRIVFRAKQHQCAGCPALAADIVDAVEWHDVRGVAGRAQPFGHVEDAIALRFARPVADRVDHVELCARRRHRFQRVRCRRLTPHGSSQQAAPADFAALIESQPGNAEHAPRPSCQRPTAAFCRARCTLPEAQIAFAGIDLSRNPITVAGRILLSEHASGQRRAPWPRASTGPSSCWPKARRSTMSAPTPAIC
jgi:hypothetical protein